MEATNAAAQQKQWPLPRPEPTLSRKPTTFDQRRTKAASVRKMATRIAHCATALMGLAPPLTAQRWVSIQEPPGVLDELDPLGVRHALLCEARLGSTGQLLLLR